MTRDIKFDLSFKAADDMLWQASAEALDHFDSLSIGRGDQLGPWVELAVAHAQMPGQYRALRFADGRLWNDLQRALKHAEICGTEYHANFGVFPLTKVGTTSQEQEIWDHWCLRFRLAAESSGFPKAFAGALTGAMGELQDNIPLHSENIRSGLVAFKSLPGAFEFVVSDQGIGVLASLQKNPDYQDLPHAGEALKIAASDGGSRFAKETGHGYGIGQLFRALAGVEGDIRFRSGDHAYELSGSGPNPSGLISLGQKSHLPGLTISITCRTRPMN
jgi:hypothetical protein